MPNPSFGGLRHLGLGFGKHYLGTSFFFLGAKSLSNSYCVYVLWKLHTQMTTAIFLSEAKPP